MSGLALALTVAPQNMKGSYLSEMRNTSAQYSATYPWQQVKQTL